MKSIKVKVLQKCFFGMKRLNVGEELEIKENELNPEVFEPVDQELKPKKKEAVKTETVKFKDEEVI
jgi:hypothetical protein